MFLDIPINPLLSYSKIQSYRLELEHLLPRLDAVLAKVKESQQQLKQMQERKQDEVWFVLKQVASLFFFYQDNFS